MERSNHSHIHNPQVQGTGVSNTLLILGGYLYPKLIHAKGKEKEEVADRFIELLSQIPHGPGSSIGRLLDQYNICPSGEFRANKLQQVVGDYIRGVFPIYPN